MQGVLEQVLLFVLRQLLSENVVKKAKEELIKWLSSLAKDTNNQIDDFMVKVIADAIGVDVP